METMLKEKEKLKEKIQNKIKEMKDLKEEINLKIKEKNIKSMFELRVRFSWLSDKYNYLNTILIPDLIYQYNNFEKQWIETQEIYKSISETLIEQKMKQNNTKIKNY